MRKRDLPAGKSLANPQIEVIQRTCANTNQNVSRADRRFRYVGIAQNFRTAVLGENDCLHEKSSLD
jgi:hypothetical protein